MLDITERRVLQQMVEQTTDIIAHANQGPDVFAMDAASLIK
jgi:hypothetical protein